MSNILFIGSGHMSEAIIRALIKNKVYKPQNILVNDIVKARLDYLQLTYGVTPSEKIVNADIIVLGVRPQDAWSDIVQQFKTNKIIIISIIAGVTIAQIKASLTVDILVLLPTLMIRRWQERGRLHNSSTALVSLNILTNHCLIFLPVMRLPDLIISIIFMNL